MINQYIQQQKAAKLNLQNKSNTTAVISHELANIAITIADYDERKGEELIQHWEAENLSQHIVDLAKRGCIWENYVLPPISTDSGMFTREKRKPTHKSCKSDQTQIEVLKAKSFKALIQVMINTTKSCSGILQTRRALSQPVRERFVRSDIGSLLGNPFDCLRSVYVWNNGMQNRSLFSSQNPGHRSINASDLEMLSMDYALQWQNRKLELDISKSDRENRVYTWESGTYDNDIVNKKKSQNVYEYWKTVYNIRKKDESGVRKVLYDQIISGELHIFPLFYLIVL